MIFFLKIIYMGNYLIVQTLIWKDFYNFVLIVYL